MAERYFGLVSSAGVSVVPLVGSFGVQALALAGAAQHGLATDPEDRMNHPPG